MSQAVEICLIGLILGGFGGMARAADGPVDVPQVTYPIRIEVETPETPEEASAATTQPFRPAVRVPRRLPEAPTIQPMTNLVFDAEVKEIKAEPLEFDLVFQFAVTNASDEAVVIGSVRTSCGCTVVDMPELPWTVVPGERGLFAVNMDVRGKSGSVTKTVLVQTDHGQKTLYVRAVLPDAATLTPEQREMNLMMAKADRQAVFKGNCASCHAVPTRNKTGGDLYEAACAICHDSAHRADMVPDLNIAKPGRDTAYWTQWITHGKEGTLMPAFSNEQGGPLSEAQIISLAHWLNRTYPSAEDIEQATPVRSAP